MQHDSNVIAFPAATRAATAAATRQASVASIGRLSSPDRERRGREIMQRVSEAEHLAALAGGVSSDISLNESLRDLRKEPWRRAEANVRFLRALLELNDATSGAQQYGVAAAAKTSVLNEVERFNLVEQCRRALIEQLLTPAPRVGDLAWKRRKVASLNPYDWVGATPGRVGKALAMDETFLRSFPARHSPNRPAD
jgi:hypothetical protein